MVMARTSFQTGPPERGRGLSVEEEDVEEGAGQEVKSVAGTGAPERRLSCKPRQVPHPGSRQGWASAGGCRLASPSVGD